MTMTEWAEKEIATACKKENPNWDGKSFDYGCSCYQSALKAYKSLVDDGHSGYSLSITKNILKKLLDEIPLSPITDDDFFIDKDRGDEGESEEYLKACKLKSSIQCPRRSSLFRKEDLDGNIYYTDINRYYCVNAENTSDIFSSSASNFIDKIYPITMPYTPSSTPFKVYVKTWLTGKTHGDFDVHEVIGYVDQQGNWHNYNEFVYFGDDKAKVITDDKEKEKLRKARIDAIEDKIAAGLIDEIEYIFLTDGMYEHDREKYNNIKAIIHNVTSTYYSTIRCKGYALAKKDKHGVCYLNTYDNQCIIVNGSDKDRTDLIGKSTDLKDLIEVVDKVKEEIQTLIKNL